MVPGKKVVRQVWRQHSQRGNETAKESFAMRDYSVKMKLRQFVSDIVCHKAQNIYGRFVPDPEVERRSKLTPEGVFGPDAHGIANDIVMRKRSQEDAYNAKGVKMKDVSPPQKFAKDVVMRDTSAQTIATTFKRCDSQIERVAPKT